MRRRVVGLVVVLVVIALSTTSCKREKDKKLDVKAAIDRTERLSRNFVYSDVTKGSRVQVSGIIEDDFRFKALLTMNGNPIEEEVADDDAYAARFIDPSKLALFLANSASANASGSTLPSISSGTTSGAGSNLAPPAVVLEALNTRHWVLDPTGAPQVLGGVGGTERRIQGQDPIVDGLTLLEYARQAVDRAEFVGEYSEDSLEPVYRSSEDPFDKPKKHSPVKRYDLKPPALPRAQQTGGTGNQATPEAAHFRKMVVYVQDKRVVRVEERVELSERQLRDLIAAFKLPKDTTAEQAMRAINVVRAGQGNDIIRVRQMKFTLTGLGTPLKVDLPTDVITGRLNVLRNRGRGATQSTGTA